MNKTRFLYITVMLILADINSWYINPVCKHGTKKLSNHATKTQIIQLVTQN